MPNVLNNMLTHFVTHHRTFITIFIIMPMSFVFELYWQIKIWLSIVTNRDAKFQHEKRKEYVRKQVIAWKEEGNGRRMCTARPTWQNMSPKLTTYKSKLYPIKVQMNEIIGIDAEKQLVHVEPGVTMGQLYKYLIPNGWTLLVNPELEELTVGGLANGYGVETSSHKYGLFCEIIDELEVVVPSGEIVRCSERENTELFRCISWSYGTIGFVVSAKLKIIPAKKYVRLQYIPCLTLESFVETFQKYQCMPNPPEFVEGILFTVNEGVVTIGDFVETSPPEEHYPLWWWKPYFFERCREMLKNKHVHIDCIPLVDYYKRHNRSIFWDIYDICPPTQYSFFRVLFGWMMPPRVQMLKYCTTDALNKFYEESYVIQDFLVPTRNLHQMLLHFDRELKVYPVWLCPMKVTRFRQQGFFSPSDPNVKEDEYEQYVDVGTFGPPGIPLNEFDMKKAIKSCEEACRTCGGCQGNYGYTYQSREEYRSMYNHDLYDQVRKNYNAEIAFPEPYDKVGRKGFAEWKTQKIDKKLN